jgi:hypothetical protein
MHGIAQAPTHASNSTAGAVTRAQAHAKSTNCFLKNTATFPHACSVSTTLTSCISRQEGTPPDQRSACTCGQPKSNEWHPPPALVFEWQPSCLVARKRRVWDRGLAQCLSSVRLVRHGKRCNFAMHICFKLANLSSRTFSSLVHCVPTCNGQRNAEYRVVRSRSRSSRGSITRWTCVCRGDVP